MNQLEPKLLFTFLPSCNARCSDSKTLVEHRLSKCYKRTILSQLWLHKINVYSYVNYLWSRRHSCCYHFKHSHTLKSCYPVMVGLQNPSHFQSIKCTSAPPTQLLLFLKPTNPSRLIWMDQKNTVDLSGNSVVYFIKIFCVFSLACRIHRLNVDSFCAYCVSL